MAETNVLRKRCSVGASGISTDGEGSSSSMGTVEPQGTDRGITEDNEFHQIRTLLMALGILCSFVIMMFRFLYLWEQYSAIGRASPKWLTIQVSVLLGIEACLLAMALLLALIVPPLIVTWTTALVFDFIFRHLTTTFGTTLAKTESDITVFSTSDDRLRRNSMRIAKEMLGLNAAGVGFVALCFIATIYLRNYFRYL
ncbi:hypothetical protein R1flu_021729 [Riccia fluitans]|uniref:Uncharacterized protein n=1 Tax=Riccia fluitans TaxID=41844 RepID=A0ABD1ZS75_9MARC